MADAHAKPQHDYHLVDPSPWPFLGAIGALEALPGIVAAVGDRMEVLFDSGIRTGADVLKALALGARGCLIGRAFLYGLAARGERGVALALEIIRGEFVASMALTGHTDARNLGRQCLVGADPR